MYNGLSENNKLFDKQTTNQINTAFSRVQDSIDELEVTDLEPKYDLQTFEIDFSELDVVVSCFRTGYEYWITIHVNPVSKDTILNVNTKRGTLPFSLPFIQFFLLNPIGTDITVESIRGKLEGDGVYLTGTLKAGVEYISNFCFVLGGTKE